MIFVDTSALYALADAGDPRHDEASLVFPPLVRSEALVTHSFVVQETAALLQARIGLDAVRSLVDELLPPVSVVFVEEPVFRAAVAALLASGERGVSLTDRTSFELMRDRGIADAFAFDEDFARQGFRTVP